MKGRKTGGRRKGGRNKSTIAKELAREVLRAQIAAEHAEMTASQIEAAKGLRFLVARAKKSGRFLRRVNATEHLNPDEELIEVWEKEPSTAAYTDLTNRYVDKPKEQPQDLNVTATVRIADILRERHAKHKPE